MAHEVETKILDIESDEVRRHLTDLGAKKIGKTRFIVDWFRQNGVTEGNDPWYLRVRSNSEGVHEVTWKARSEITGIARRHKEINFLIEHPRELADLFEEIGLEKYAHQEKDRTSFALKGWLFEIDDYPGVPPFLEIEGRSEGHVREAIELLGLGRNRTWAEGERMLIQLVYKRNWYDMRF